MSHFHLSSLFSFYFTVCGSEYDSPQIPDVKCCWDRTNGPVVMSALAVDLIFVPIFSVVKENNIYGINAHYTPAFQITISSSFTSILN